METSGAEIARTMVRQAKSFGCNVLSQSNIANMDLSSSPKRIEVEEEGVFTADAVVIATGGVPRTLGIPSETTFKGKGISCCATGDGNFFTGKEIVAVGGGNSALEEAVSLSKFASKVTVVHEFDHFQAQPWAVAEAKANPKIEFMSAKNTLEFKGNEQLETVVISDKKTGELTEIPAAGCFIFIGYKPKTEWLRGVVMLNKRGEIVTDDAPATIDKSASAGSPRRSQTAPSQPCPLRTILTGYISTLRKRKPPLDAHRRSRSQLPHSTISKPQSDIRLFPTRSCRPRPTAR